MGFDLDVVIVGGCGRVGLPLGLAFADRGLSVVLLDRDESAVRRVVQGVMPFAEDGADEILERVRGSRLLSATTDTSVVGSAEHVIVVIGTPVDEHLNPDISAVSNIIASLSDHLSGGQLLILRSTVYPGVTARVEADLNRVGRAVEVAFCPERIAEGRALTEIFELPQIVSARTPRAMERAEKLFRNLTTEVVRLEPEEAELAKLFTNAWRYIKFATANQFFMIASDFGLDFERIRSALTYRYSRAQDLPGAGFAAGPCLFKDTAQLAAFNNNNFHLGQAAMMINEGLPLYLVSRMEQRYDLSRMTVGILGMAFKGDSDDTRSSLSYKLKRILAFKTRAVLCSDPFVATDTDLVPIQKVLRESDLVVIGAPHSQYRHLDIGPPVMDVWGIVGRGR